MDLKDKIIKALYQQLKPEYVRLEEDGGISGFIVARQFDRVSSMDRQRKIEEALKKGMLTQQEQRQVLMIAGLTPLEYDAVGVRIRVHRVREMPGGAVEVLLHGTVSDAEYVREVLNNHKGVRTTEPKQVASAVGIVRSFQANGPEADALTKAKTIRLLKTDSYIEVLAKA